MKRLKQTTFLITLSALAAALLTTHGLTADEGVELKSYERPRQLTEQEIRARVGTLESLLHVPDTYVEPDYKIQASDLERHGIYRIVPANFVGELPYLDRYNANPPERGLATSDVNILRQSPLYVDLANLMPAGFHLVMTDTFDGDSNTIVRQVYRTTDGASIEVTRVRRFHEPIDIYAPTTDGRSALDMTLTTIQGNEAVMFMPPSDTPLRFSIASVHFYGGGIETHVLAEDVEPKVVLQIAQELAAAIEGTVSGDTPT
jgi:hypothetical protein